jgi:acyl-CoA synthetase (AMP-forming)/AMP-acid ligase II
LEPGDPLVLQDSLRRAAAHEAPAGITCVQRDDSEVTWTYAELIAKAERVMRGLRHIGLRPGDRALFQFSDNQDFICAFWGCVLGGFVPVPAALPPSYQPPNSSLSRLQSSWEMLDRPLILAGAKQAREIRSWTTQAGLDVRVAALEELQDRDANGTWHGSKPEEVALILLTSGSTGLPKGVQLTHRNLIMRSAASRQLNGFSKDEITMNWLPLDHVGGIVYFHLRDVFLGCRQIHAPTDSFSGTTAEVVGLDRASSSHCDLGAELRVRPDQRSCRRTGSPSTRSVVDALHIERWRGCCCQNCEAFLAAFGAAWIGADCDASCVGNVGDFFRCHVFVRIFPRLHNR